MPALSRLQKNDQAIYHGIQINDLLTGKGFQNNMQMNGQEEVKELTEKSQGKIETTKKDESCSKAKLVKVLGPKNSRGA